MFSLIPGSIIYQIHQLSTLKNNYEDEFTYASPNKPSIGDTLIAKLPHPKTEKFYHICSNIDRLLGSSLLASMAKIIVGLACAIFFPILPCNIIGLGIAIEGCLQMSYSMYHMRKVRWHAVHEFHKVHSDGLQLSYDKINRVLFNGPLSKLLMVHIRDYFLNWLFSCLLGHI